VDPHGSVDCDVHPAVPGMAALLPYISPEWREHITVRGIDHLDLTSYPPNTPLAARPDWRPASGKPGASLAMLQSQALDRFASRFAICNCLWGAQAVFNADFAAALCRGINTWLAAEWLDREKRLRASIVVPWQDPDLAAAEIDRLAGDPRFVQVLLPVMTDMPLGRRSFWPIYAAAARHGLPVGIHAGGAYRHAPTSIGWPSYYVEDYVAQSQIFQSQVMSLVYEGVFTKFPDLVVVLIESGFTWLPSFMWRMNKTWRGVRIEVPWVGEPPAEIIRQHIRLTTQPLDAPPDQATFDIIMEQLGSDRMLLFSTDYPHWQFDGDQALPAHLSPAQRLRIGHENPFDTYPRLKESVP
jgi:predicted TIM-barrel fold metal-dependent hydrolase